MPRSKTWIIGRNVTVGSKHRPLVGTADSYDAQLKLKLFWLKIIHMIGRQALKLKGAIAATQAAPRETQAELNESVMEIPKQPGTFS